METPLCARPTLLTVVTEVTLEGIISDCMTSDVFILLISQTNRFGHAQSRVRERRFYLRLERGDWVYRDRLRGLVGPDETHD